MTVLEPKEEGRPPSLEDREEVRRRIRECGNVFNPGDVQEFITDDICFDRYWMHAFYMPGQQRDDCFTLAKEAFRWREEFGARDIKEEDIDEDDKQEGGLYYRPRDRQGRRVLVFSTRRHFRDPTKSLSRKRLVVYLMERLQREERGKEICIMFDCEKAGIRNLDMELTQFIVQVLMVYYPSLVHTILVYEMPWVLNAAWKVIKSWLPGAAVNRIKFVNRDGLNEFIDEDNRLAAWGGRDTWQYAWEPELRLPAAGGAAVATGPATLTSIMEVVPGSMLSFGQNDEGEYSSKLEIRNITTCPIVYKVKTTSPEVFRVRPHVGLIQPASLATISITSMGGVPRLFNERFQILSTKVPAAEVNINKTPAELFSQGSSQGYAETKLRCRMQNENDDDPGKRLRNGSGGGATLSAAQTVSASVAELTRKVELTEGQLRTQLRLNVLLVIINLVTLVMVYLYAGRPAGDVGGVEYGDGGGGEEGAGGGRDFHEELVELPLLNEEL